MDIETLKLRDLIINCIIVENYGKDGEMEEERGGKEKEMEKRKRETKRG